MCFVEGAHPRMNMHGQLATPLIHFNCRLQDDVMSGGAVLADY